MTKQKMIYDALGNPIPQHLDEESGFYIANTNGTGDAIGVDFSKIKMIYDALGNDIPQYFDVVEGVFKPITSEGSSGEGIPVNHTHKIADVEGLDERLTEVFTQVSNGKKLLETTISEKGSLVDKVGDIATFDELNDAILKIKNTTENGEIFENFEYIKGYYLGYGVNEILSDVAQGVSGSEIAYFPVESDVKYLIYAPNPKPRFRYMFGNSLLINNNKNQNVGSYISQSVNETLESEILTTPIDAKYLYVYLSNDSIHRPCWIMKLTDNYSFLS